MKETNKYAMPFGTENPRWDEFVTLTKKCATLACELRGSLEELSQVMWDYDAAVVNGEDGTCMYSDDINDFAYQVGEVENALFNDETED